MALFLLWSIPLIGILIFLYLAAYYSIYLRKKNKKKHQRRKKHQVEEESTSSNSFQVTDPNAQHS